MRLMTMDFGQALAELRAGRKVSRAGWNGKGMYVALSPGFELVAERVYSRPIREEIGTGVGVFRAYLMFRTVDGEFVPWVATQSDLLAEDWDTTPPAS
jgi:hypothetical protein